MEEVVAIRHTTIVGIFTVMLTLVTGLVFAEHVIDDSKNTGYLFVISGTSGSLDGDTLTLNGVPNVIYTSRNIPHRIARHLSLEIFVESWKKVVGSFKGTGRNATLYVLTKDGAKNVVVELMSAEQKSGSVVFKVTVLDGTLSGSFGTAAFYIDICDEIVHPWIREFIEGYLFSR